MSAALSDDRLRRLAECLAAATRIAESGVQIDEATLSDFDRRMLERGRQMAAIVAKRDARMDAAIGQSRNVVDARRAFRAR